MLPLTYVRFLIIHKDDRRSLSGILRQFCYNLEQTHYQMQMFHLWPDLLPSKFLKRKAVPKSNKQDICMKRWKVLHPYRSCQHSWNHIRHNLLYLLQHPRGLQKIDTLARQTHRTEKLQTILETDPPWNRRINIILLDLRGWSQVLPQYQSWMPLS